MALVSNNVETQQNMSCEMQQVAIAQPAQIVVGDLEAGNAETVAYQPQQSNQAAKPAKKEKKQCSTCKIVCIVLGVLFLGGLIGLGIWLYMFFSVADAVIDGVNNNMQIKITDNNANTTESIKFDDIQADQHQGQDVQINADEFLEAFEALEGLEGFENLEGLEASFLRHRAAQSPN